MRSLAVTSSVRTILQASGLPERRVANIFHPLGTQAATEYQLALFTFAITGVIFVIVAGLLIYTIWKFRRRPTDNTGEEPPQVYGSNQIEIAWTFIPILGVFVLMGITARFIFSLQNTELPKFAEHITVVGHQWWWEVRYADHGFTTANEIHIPLSGSLSAGSANPVLLQLESADVIHSFWVPQLAGKTDLIPGRANTMWIDAQEPGIYLGNCAEYCGTQHANMLLRVIAQPKAEFDQWVSAQRLPAAAVTSVSKGRDLYESLSCVDCHTVRGTTSQGVFGPDLTHLMSRSTIGAGMIANAGGNMRSWVDDPQQMKPGCLMPSMKLTGAELDQVTSYLQTLR